MSDTTQQPSELAMEIANALYPFLKEENPKVQAAFCTINRKLAEHEAAQWKDASEPPDNGRVVYALSDGNEIVESYFVAHQHRWLMLENGDPISVVKWREIVIPAPPKASIQCPS